MLDLIDSQGAFGPHQRCRLAALTGPSDQGPSWLRRSREKGRRKNGRGLATLISSEIFVKQCSLFCCQPFCWRMQGESMCTSHRSGIRRLRVFRAVGRRSSCLLWRTVGSRAGASQRQNLCSSIASESPVYNVRFARMIRACAY